MFTSVTRNKSTVSFHKLSGGVGRAFMWNIGDGESGFFAGVTCLIRHYVNDTLHDKNNLGWVLWWCQGCLGHGKVKNGRREAETSGQELCEQNLNTSTCSFPLFKQCHISPIHAGVHISLKRSILNSFGFKDNLSNVCQSSLEFPGIQTESVLLLQTSLNGKAAARKKNCKVVFLGLIFLVFSSGNVKIKTNISIFILFGKICE